MKRNICFAIFLSIIIVHIGCKKDEKNPIATTVVASEVWGFISSNDSANHSEQTLEKKSDGSVAVNGTWYFVYQGSTVQCSISSGTAIIADTVISMTTQGTANDPSAPTGYQSSAFTSNVTGIAHNGKSSGTWSLTFSTYGWPSMLQGTYTATRKSGSGITK